MSVYILFFFLYGTATTEIYTYWHTLSLHDALPISPRWFHQPFGHAYIARPVGGLGQLHHNAVGNSHCLMHDPERASAAESREFQSRCRMPLGDIACHVHAAEKERRSAFFWTLQCRQAVGGLFETTPNKLAKPGGDRAQ